MCYVKFHIRLGTFIRTLYIKVGSHKTPRDEHNHAHFTDQVTYVYVSNMEKYKCSDPKALVFSTKANTA